MNKKKYQYNNHHLIPKSKGGANQGVNIKTERIDKHINLHNFFGNDTPCEQLVRVLRYNWQVFDEEFRRELLDMLRQKCKYKDNAILDKEVLKRKEHL